MSSPTRSCKTHHRDPTAANERTALLARRDDDDDTRPNASRHPEEPTSDRRARVDLINDDVAEGSTAVLLPPASPSPPPVDLDKDKSLQVVTWASLPRKKQLAVIVLTRLAEPFFQTSLRVKSFDPHLPESIIASRAGLMQGAFAASGLCTNVFWGRLSDAYGRKRMLLLGLAGTLVSCLGLGFSRTYWQALLFRMLSGAFNANAPVLRTMVAETVREKKYFSRAFLLMPMAMNVGSIVGPICGGLLSDPARQYPATFGHVQWLRDYPYAAPNIFSACILCLGMLGVFVGLEETHARYTNKKDLGYHLGQMVTRYSTQVLEVLGVRSNKGYKRVPLNDDMNNGIRGDIVQKHPKPVAPKYSQRLPFRRIFTYNVICTQLTNFLNALSTGFFNIVFYSYLSSNVASPGTQHSHKSPLAFSGGLGLRPTDVGLAMAILGGMGLLIQLFIYPHVADRFGNIRAWRVALYLYPVALFFCPFLSLIPSSTPPPAGKTGPLVWLALGFVISIYTTGRTFVNPATVILTNNCSPHPTVLGTIHGIAGAANNAAKMFGPTLGGILYGVGLKTGVVGLAFWVLAGMACCTCVASSFVKEGNGHEIRLEGDDEAEAEAEKENRALGLVR